jgi:acyl carrier protein
VELGEVEKVMEGYEGVKESVVEVRGEEGEEVMVCYVVKEGWEAEEERKLREYMKRLLPSQMVPGRYVKIEEIPLTVNGKVDRERLEEEEREWRKKEERVEEYRSETEEEVERVGRGEDFFELGGHSLLAMQVISRVREVFRIDLQVQLLFSASTVAAFAEEIDAAIRIGAGLQSKPIEPVSRDQDLPLSFAQLRIWFLDQLQPGNVSYHIPGAVRLAGRLKVAAIEQTLSEIMRRHEALRTTFPTVAGEPVQVIQPPKPLALPIIDLGHLPEAERELAAERLANLEAQHTFNLSKGPLFRVTLLRLDEEHHIVVFVMHHIVSDGWSTGIFIQEVAQLYEALSTGRPSQLPELRIQYADFAAWQRHWLQGEVLRDYLSHWTNLLGEGLSVLDLPVDHPRPQVQSYRGERQYAHVSAAVTRSLNALSQSENVTLFMTMLAAFKCLLHRYTGQEDMVIATGIANRNRAETEALIGFFVNMLVLRTNLAGNPSFKELLGRVKEVTLGAYAYQDLPFDKLVEVLRPERRPSGIPLLQVVFVLQNAPVSTLTLPGLTLTPFWVDTPTTHFDLMMEVAEIGQELTLSLEYSTDLFEPSTISRVLNHYVSLLEAIVTDPTSRLLDIPLALESGINAVDPSSRLRSNYAHDEFTFGQSH